MKFEFRTYRRRFKQPMVTAHGTWKYREGVIIRVEDADGRVGFGECAPLPHFGTETLDQAVQRLKDLNGHIPADESVLDALEVEFPCLRSAFDMAFMSFESAGSFIQQSSLAVTVLLPNNFAAIESMASFYEMGYRHFKWKVGNGEPVIENAVFLQLMRLLPEDADLRIDANGAFDRDVARQWLRFMEGHRVAWFEQPMSAVSVTEMSLLAKEFLRTPIALDESVCRVKDLAIVCERPWRGYLVVKPTIMGSRKAFLNVREHYKPKLVYSTSFETSIGLQYLIQLAATDPHPNRSPLGLGGEHLFSRDGLCIHEFGAKMGVWSFSSEDFESVWSQLAPV